MCYERVIPRDLFNESKLLKCLGRLALLIHDGLPYRLTVLHDRPADGFEVEQNTGDGSIYCANLLFYLDGQLLHLSSVYNSKSPYPLTCDEANGEYVFDDDGSLSAEFVEMCTA